MKTHRANVLVPYWHVFAILILLTSSTSTLGEKLLAQAPFGPSHSHVFSDVGCSNTEIKDRNPLFDYVPAQTEERQTDCWISAYLWTGYRHLHYFTENRDRNDLKAHVTTASLGNQRVQARATITDTRKFVLGDTGLLSFGYIKIEPVSVRYVAR